MLERFLVPFPTLIHGTRCYTDASTQPDLAVSLPRDAGIGVFIINTQMSPPLSIFIKAAMQDSTSVLMAESAALALATVLLENWSYRMQSFYQNQQLVHFLNGADLSNPPDWRIKPYTQMISPLLAGTSSSIRKISRSQNQMADSLARQALTVFIPISIVSQVFVLIQNMFKSAHYLWHSNL